MELFKTTREEVYDSLFLDGHNPEKFMLFAITHPGQEIIVPGDREVLIPSYVFMWDGKNWYHNEEEK